LIYVKISSLVKDPRNTEYITWTTEYLEVITRQRFSKECVVYVYFCLVYNNSISKPEADQYGF